MKNNFKTETLYRKKKSAPNEGGPRSYMRTNPIIMTIVFSAHMSEKNPRTTPAKSKVTRSEENVISGH